MAKRVSIQDGRKRQIARNGETGYTTYRDGNTLRVGDLREEAPLRVPGADVARNRERALRMNMGYVLFLTLAAALTVMVCIDYLKLQAVSTQLRKQVTGLETTLADAQLENETKYNQVISNVDLEEVRERAINELGMAYPTEGQIITYESADRDYVRQYQEIPG